MSKSGSDLIQPQDITEEQANWLLGQCNPRERAFVEEMLCDYKFDMKAAAAKAGYANPRVQGKRLIQRPKVLQLIGKMLQDRMRRAEVTADRVLREIARIAFLDPAGAFDAEGHVLNPPDMPEEVRRALAGFDIEYEQHREDPESGWQSRGKKVKVRFWSKDENLDRCAKHVGILKELAPNVNFVSVDWHNLYSLIGELAKRQREQAASGVPALPAPPDDAEVVEEEDPVEKRIAAVKQRSKNGDAKSQGSILGASRQARAGASSPRSMPGVESVYAAEGEGSGDIG
jgi:phage terminase small subunit